MKNSPSTLSLATWLLVLPLLIPAAGHGLTYVKVSDETLADRADAIVEVRMLEVDPSPDAGRPVTDYRMAVERVIHGGAVASPLIVRVLGGILPDGIGLQVHGAPSFAQDQRALLFLKSGPGGVYRILHFQQGAFHLMEHEGMTLAFRRLAEGEELQLPGRVPPLDGPRDLDRFRSWLADRARQVQRAADYFVSPAGIPDKFTVLRDPVNRLMIRWRTFDTGGGATFRAHADGQPGVSGGGFSQFQSALAVWQNDPDTPIRYSYGGTTTASGGLTTFDNINAILFDDPNDNPEFDEPFNCQDGGTIAIGGPWYDRNSRHTHNGQTFNTAVGGDIVTNKGIDCIPPGSSQPWFGQRRRSDEVFAHELGHTLALGHSCGDDNSPSCSNPTLNNALMRANIHGDNRGARLESDDRAGIRFLYGDPVNPPAAPSNLTADAVSGSQIDLFWTDNSGDEESFDLERRIDGGSFQRIALPAANVTSFQDTTVVPNATYTYRIRAFNDGGTSAFSNTATASTFSLAAPSDLSAFGVSDSRIRLFWTDESLTETGFEIEGRAGSAPFNLLQTVPAGSETADIAGLNAITTYTFRVRAVSTAGISGYSNEASSTTFFSDPDPCVAGPETLCLQDGRFRIEVTWTDFIAQNGPGTDVGLASPDSGLFYFFSANNWEMLVKVIDACDSETRHFWVFAAATTNVAYELMVTDSISGFSKTYTNELGVSSPAIIDTAAFPTCFAEVPEAAAPAVAAPPGAEFEEKGGCEASNTRFCFNGGRYAVELEWRNFAGETGLAQVDPLQSGDSGLFYFVDPQNLEVLVKVLDGCSINNHVWVFAAATTNLEYTLRVTDTVTNVPRQYFNELGNAADAITDTLAFGCP